MLFRSVPMLSITSSFNYIYVTLSLFNYIKEYLVELMDSNVVQVCPDAVIGSAVPFEYSLTYGTDLPIEGYAELDISDNIKEDVSDSLIPQIVA